MIPTSVIPVCAVERNLPGSRGPDLIYVDSSALVKLVVEEPESDPLRTLLARDPRQFASAIVEVEVVRAVRRVAPELVSEARRVVTQLDVIEAGEVVRARAALLDPLTLRSLDAIHLATALEAADELDGLITYDSRLAAAAETFGIAVFAPS